jgi:hypothetical protein
MGDNMASTALPAFIQAFRDQYNRSPVWPPGSDMALGDVGLIKDGEFVKQDSLANLGIEFSVDRGNRKIDYNFSDGHGVSADVGISGDSKLPLGGVPPGNFGVQFAYAGKGSFNLTASGCRIDRIDNISAVHAAIMMLHNDSHWDYQWRYVTSIVVAERFAIAIAGESSASATLDLGISVPPPKLAKASVDASFTQTSNLAWHGLALEGGPLMYEAWHLHVPVLFGPAEPRRGVIEPKQGALPMPD